MNFFKFLQKEELSDLDSLDTNSSFTNSSFSVDTFNEDVNPCYSCCCFFLLF